MNGGVFTLAVALAGPFEYDRSEPLDVEERQIAAGGGIRVSRIEFTSSKGRRVGALLVAPEQIAGVTAGIVWVHAQGSECQVNDAIVMARAGAVSLLLSPTNTTPLDANRWRTEMVETVVSIRQAVDLLCTRPDVDPERIAFVGTGFGAIMGCNAMAVDKRFRTAVLEDGVLSMSAHIRNSPLPWAADMRASLGSELNSFITTIEPLDAAHYLPHLSPAPVLYQAAQSDMVAREFIEAANEPKETAWYEAANGAAMADRTRFLARQLQLPSIEPFLEMPVLPSLAARLGRP